MTDNIDIDGEIDAGFTSYWNPEEHGQMDKTVSGTTEEDKGEEKTVAIPKEVNLDDLTDLQEHIIRVAAKNPHLSSTDVADRVSCHHTYPRQFLQDKCQNWYENVFKKHGQSKNQGRPTEDGGTEEQENTTEQTQEVEEATQPEKIQTACEAILSTSENTELVNFAEWILEQCN